MKNLKIALAAASLAVPLFTAGTALAAGKVKQPHMEATTKHIDEALKELEAATANKGGHREKAIDLLKQAKAEVEEGMKYADEHPEKAPSKK